MSDKKKNVYTKENLIKMISNSCNEKTSTVRTVYNTFEETIYNLLSKATGEADIRLKLFEGIKIDSSFVPEKTKLNNLTKEVITTTDKIVAKATVTRNYNDKLTSNV